MCERCGCGTSRPARSRLAPLGKGGRWHVHADGTAHRHPDEHDAAGGHAEAPAPGPDDGEAPAPDQDR